MQLQVCLVKLNQVGGIELTPQGVAQIDSYLQRQNPAYSSSSQIKTTAAAVVFTLNIELV